MAKRGIRNPKVCATIPEPIYNLLCDDSELFGLTPGECIRDFIIEKYKPQLVERMKRESEFMQD
jgi:hypothetical protein